MLTMKLGDGTTFTVTGEEAKKTIGTFKKVMYDHAKIAEIHRVTKQIKKDTAYLVKAVPENVQEQIETINLTGDRREQFERTRVLMREHASWSLYRACTQVLKELKLADGYPSVDSLHRYCLEHPRMFY